MTCSFDARRRVTGRSDDAALTHRGRADRVPNIDLLQRCTKRRSFGGRRARHLEGTGARSGVPATATARQRSFGSQSQEVRAMGTRLTRRRLVQAGGATAAGLSVAGVPAAWSARAAQASVRIRAAGFVESQEQLQHTIDVLAAYAAQHPDVEIVPRVHRLRLLRRQAGDRGGRRQRAGHDERQRRHHGRVLPPRRPPPPRRVRARPDRSRRLRRGDDHRQHHRRPALRHPERLHRPPP
jgi:hypothetical protein